MINPQPLFNNFPIKELWRGPKIINFHKHPCLITLLWFTHTEVSLLAGLGVHTCSPAHTTWRKDCQCETNWVLMEVLSQQENWKIIQFIFHDKKNLFTMTRSIIMFNVILILKVHTFWNLSVFFIRHRTPSVTSYEQDFVKAIIFCLFSSQTLFNPLDYS